MNNVKTGLTVFIDNSTSRAWLRLVRFGVNRDSESWRWCAVVECGELDSDPCEREEQVLRGIEHFGIYVSSAGNGSAGRPFSNPPWVDFYDGFAVVSQTGGLDV